MNLQTNPRFWLFSLLVLATATNQLHSADMHRVQLAADGKGFVLHPSGPSFIPWGHNYASVDILERFGKDPQRVKREFADMKAAGTNVARIHPEMPRFFLSPEEVDPKALRQLKQILEIAEEVGIYLKITGLACYRIADRLSWYDTMDEQDRWKMQAYYWETIARACADSPAVFAYDLINEPAAIGKPDDGWYTGRMGDFEFCQRLTLDPGERDANQIFQEWTQQMVDSIRKHDRDRLITIGMLLFPGAYKVASESLDFVSPHIYPKSGKVDEAIEMLQKFDWGKPIVIGETFPLTCSAKEERTFLLRSRKFADGWIGHWPDESPVELERLKETGQATIQNAIWLSWVQLFEEVGPEMTISPPK